MLYVSPSSPRCEHRPKRARMIVDVQPIPDLPAVAIDGQRRTSQRAQDHVRDQLLRKLIRAVVVRAIRHQHGQLVGSAPGAAPNDRSRPSSRRRASSAHTASSRETAGRLRPGHRRPRPSTRAGNGTACRFSPVELGPVARARPAASAPSRRDSSRRNASGLSIERSTWLSAAKFITASGACSANTFLQRGSIADVDLDERVARRSSNAGERIEVPCIGETCRR